jgi:phenylpropionate dioxygenase-like ring-hydroxylating dioxygenase large terminal subunit
VAHVSSFDSPGSYLVINHPSGLPLLLVLGKDNVLRCFHNVCRHRAYPVVSTRREGRTPLLTCQYHGWTYDLKGQLIKAPKFEAVEGFERDRIGLYQVHTKVDANGFVLINLSEQAVAGESIDTQEVRKDRVHRWEAQGRFNWKLTGKWTPRRTSLSR